MALILGIDPSSKKIAAVAGETLTGTWKVHSGNLYPKGTTKQTPESIHAAMPFMRDFLASVSKMAPVGQRFAYVEEPLVGPGIAATIKQTYVGGVIRACLVEAGFSVYDAHPSRWRSALGIKATGAKGTRSVALKAATVAYVKANDPKLFRLVEHDGDLIDGAGIWFYGREQVRKAGVIVAAGPAGGPVSDDGPRVVVRPARVRRVVRR